MNATQRMARVLLVALVTSLATACQRPLKPVFSPLPAPLAWPPPPAEARIRYVGQLKSSADLKPPAKAFQGLTDFLIGKKAPQELFGPRAVTVSRDGRFVWIADPGGRCVHCFDIIGRTYTKITEVGGKPLLSPVALCLEGDRALLVCDSEGVAIHRLDVATGAFLSTLELPEDVLRPVALYHDEERSELFVVDVLDHNIKVLDKESRLLRILGTRGNASGTFNFPSDITSDGSTLWIADTGNHRIQGIRFDGKPVMSFGQAGDAPGDLAMPKGVALDSDGHLYVVDARFENVQIFSPKGDLLLYFGEEGTGPGAFWLPAGIFIDNEDRIWVCDTYNRRVQVFEFLRKAPKAGTEPDADDQPTTP